MSLCATALTPTCETEVQRLVALIPDAELAAFAAAEPGFLQGGFRLGNAPALRARVTQLLVSQAPVSDALRQLVARRACVRTLTGLLSPTALADSRQALAALLGADVLTVALLLDERPDVRALAEGWLSASKPFLTVEASVAQRQLREQFDGLAELLGADTTNGAPASRTAWHAQKEQLELRVRDLQDENRRLRGSDDRLANASRKLAAAEKDLAACRAKQEAADRALREANGERERLAVELARETTRRNERLTAALDVALATEFFGWLGQARAVEQEATRPDDAQADLLARAERALRRQSEVDRHSGNRFALEERLDQLREARRRAASALRAALRPTSELKAVEDELEGEIRRLSALSDPDAPSTSFEDALVTRIHAADDNELPALRTLPNFVESLRVLDEPALARLRLAYQRRLAAAQAVGVPPDPFTEEKRNAVSRLGRALSGREPAILLIDGHNALFGLPARYNPPRGGALSDAEKRKRLTEDVVKLCAPSPTLRAWIVFDGPTRSDTQASPNVRVTYSGGNGEHRADAVLLDNLRFFKSTSPELAVFLVSNDGELCSSARRLGAESVAVLEFGAFL